MGCGNKGCCFFDFEYKKYSFGFCSCHLPAGQNKKNYLDRKETFKHIDGWLNLLTNINKEEVIIFLVGNNKELIDGREVSYEEGEKFAKENGFIFQEISARTGEGFSELFYNKLLKEIKNKFKPFEKNSNSKKKINKYKFEIIKDVKINKETKKGCYN